MNWSPELASEFAADLAVLDPPVTWVELARMARTGRFATPGHETVFDRWRERYSQHLAGNVGPRTVRPSQVSTWFKGAKK